MNYNIVKAHGVFHSTSIILINIKICTLHQSIFYSFQDIYYICYIKTIYRIQYKNSL